MSSSGYKSVSLNKPMSFFDQIGRFSGQLLG
jgi:hypothetical protein